MGTIEEVKKLIVKHDYIGAARLLDRLLGKDRDSDALWYLRGLVSLRLKHYDAAAEALEHALWIRKRPEYWRMKGFAHMEACEFEYAIKSFSHALRMEGNDATTCALIAFCYMFLNNPNSKHYLQRAYLLDKKKTKGLLLEFYDIFFKPDHRLSDKAKSLLQKKLEGIQE